MKPREGLNGENAFQLSQYSHMASLVYIVRLCLLNGFDLRKEQGTKTGEEYVNSLPFRGFTETSK